MADMKRDKQPAARAPGAGAPGAAAGPTAAAPGKQTRVESQGHALPKQAATAGGAPTAGPGPRTGIGVFAGALFTAKSPRELQRKIPSAVLAQHQLLPTAGGAAAGAAPVQRKAGPGAPDQVHEAATHGTSGSGGPRACAPTRSAPA
jgi:hypothetical protein